MLHQLLTTHLSKLPIDRNLCSRNVGASTCGRADSVLPDMRGTCSLSFANLVLLAPPCFLALHTATDLCVCMCLLGDVGAIQLEL